MAPSNWWEQRGQRMKAQNQDGWLLGCTSVKRLEAEALPVEATERNDGVECVCSLTQCLPMGCKVFWAVVGFHLSSSSDRELRYFKHKVGTLFYLFWFESFLEVLFFWHIKELKGSVFLTWLVFLSISVNTNEAFSLHSYFSQWAGELLSLCIRFMSPSSHHGAITGVSIVQGCGCGLHPGGVAAVGPWGEDDLQGRDAGELQPPCLRGWGDLLSELLLCGGFQFKDFILDFEEIKKTI